MGIFVPLVYHWLIKNNMQENMTGTSADLGFYIHIPQIHGIKEELIVNRPSYESKNCLKSIAIGRKYGILNSHHTNIFIVTPFTQEYLFPVRAGLASPTALVQYTKSQFWLTVLIYMYLSQLVDAYIRQMLVRTHWCIESIVAQFTRDQRTEYVLYVWTRSPCDLALQK